MGDREEKTVLFDESMLQQYQKNMTGKSSLVIVDGSGIQEYDLSKFVDGAYTFGRNENNSIRLNSSIVSGNHGELYLQEGRCYIRDNHSSNGSYLAYGTQFIQMAPDQYYGGDGRDMIVRLGTNHSMDGIDPVLLLYNGQQKEGRWKTYSLHDGDNSIGRAADCDIRLKNVAISRYHAGVRKVKNQFYVFDNGSTNGVFVNGSRIVKPYCLSNKDIFTILKDADCHFAGFVSKIIVADGKCCNTTCLADTFCTSDYRNLCRKTDVVDDLSIGCYSIICRCIDHITVIGSCGNNG